VVSGAHRIALDEGGAAGYHGTSSGESNPGFTMKDDKNPFAELIDVLKHNGYANAPLTDIPGPQFFNLLKKAGWDQAWSGRGETHILKRLRERGPSCGIRRLIDFARALESGVDLGPDQWASIRYDARVVVNWRRKGFVTFLRLSDKDLTER
jgi:hypothetical protein